MGQIRPRCHTTAGLGVMIGSTMARNRNGLSIDRALPAAQNCPSATRYTRIASAAVAPSTRYRAWMPRDASEAEARRAVQAFESVGVGNFLVIFRDDRRGSRHVVETVDGSTLRQRLRDYRLMTGILGIG